MEKLKNVIELICNKEELNNTVSFYIKVMNCIQECLKLIDLSCISSNEKAIFERGCKIWKTQNYNSMELYKLYCTISKKCNTINTETKEHHTLQAISYLLMPYKEWPDDERANTLEYFIGDIIRAGVNPEKIYLIIKTHFKDIADLP